MAQEYATGNNDVFDANQSVDSGITVGEETDRSAKSSTSSYCSCGTVSCGTVAKNLLANDMEEEVFNNFIFRFVQPEDYPKILAHMRQSFYRDEPLNAITGYSEEKAQDMDLMISAYFKDGLSSIVLEKSSNKVAGARIMAIHRRHSTKSDMTLTSPEMRKIMPFLDSVEKEAKIFDHYPEVDEYVELFMASVHPTYRGQGLASAMYRGAVSLLRSRGYKLMKSCFTSPYTRRIGEKMGFRELAVARFNEYRDETGQLVFPTAADDAVAAIGVLEI